MSEQRTHISTPPASGREDDEPALNPILVFSPDPDVARSLSMLLEETYGVETETDLKKLEDHVNRLNPPLLLVDLYPLPPDILRTVEILKRRREKNPVIMFHVFRNSKPELEQAIHSVSDIVLYKPINAELVLELISVLMAVYHSKRMKPLPEQ